MSDYKDWWNERYQELAFEKFGCEYYECTDDQRTELDRTMTDVVADHFADQIDRAKEERKYKELT